MPKHTLRASRCMKSNENWEMVTLLKIGSATLTHNRTNLSWKLIKYQECAIFFHKFYNLDHCVPLTLWGEASQTNLITKVLRLVSLFSNPNRKRSINIARSINTKFCKWAKTWWVWVATRWQCWSRTLCRTRSQRDSIALWDLMTVLNQRLVPWQVFIDFPPVFQCLVWWLVAS